MFQLGGLKAPGPDGFPGVYFQKNWSCVRVKLCKAVKSFFDDGFLLRDLNQTFIALIPKVPNPTEVNHFRPISLCNFIYKVIAKCMANRLRGVIKDIVSPNQAAFVPGRLIQDSIILAHEAFHFLKGKKRGKCKEVAFKIDLNKAYDRVEWISS